MSATTTPMRSEAVRCGISNDGVGSLVVVGWFTG